MLVDENGKEIKFKMTDNLPMSGMGGTIKRTTDGDCVKLFYHDNGIYANYEILHRIRELDLKSLYKIKDFLFNSGEFIGYTMKYYRPCERNIMLDNMSVFIDNMVCLYNDTMALSREHILMCDNCIQNIVYSNRRVVIIDCDCYKYASGYKLYDTNLRLYLDLMIDLITNSVFYCDIKDIFKVRKMSKLFDMETFDLDRNVRILEQFERPVDALKVKCLIK